MAVVLGSPPTLANELDAPHGPGTGAALPGCHVAGPPSVTHHPEHVLVCFKAGTARGARQAVHETARAKGVLADYHVVPGLQLVEVAEDVLPDALAVYRNHPDVLYAEPDYSIHADELPTDPDFDKLWGLYNTGQTVSGDPGTAGADIRAPQAWDLWTGAPDFRIAVIDSGVNYLHPDLRDNIWTNYAELYGAAGFDDDGNGYVDDIHGYDFENDDGDPLGDHYHGSHVAGTIGAVANNDEGIVGVNWRCRIVALKIFGGEGASYTSNAIAAQQYIVDNNIRVSNSSWGTGTFSQALHDAIAASQAVGHVFVASAGNNSDDTDINPHYPSSYDLPNVISVAATDNDDALGVFFNGETSNYGLTTVDLGAPGINIYSTILGEDYAYLDGTSMAAPHVTGVTALVMSRYPAFGWEEVKDRILETARPVAALDGLTVTGGVVNAFAALSDCNQNDVADDDDIAGGTSEDCTGNGIPDECEPDCNGNGAADSCDILQGLATDCGENGVPDSCEEFRDCNGNGVYDPCDIRDGTSDDCDANGYPDDCEPDCNGDGIADECDISAGTSDDCNANRIPDECEPDCNGNNVADECDISEGTSQDCNQNDVPDECDVAAGTSGDCDGDLVPDECEFDCNKNGVPDDCDIIGGTSVDLNYNGVLDECEAPVIYVNALASGAATGMSWADAYQDLQEALTIADYAGGTIEEIWVAARTYRPSKTIDPDDPRTATFHLVDGVAVYGGFAGYETSADQRNPLLNVTVLSGDLNNNDGTINGKVDNTYHVVTSSYNDTTAILDGFTITAGYGSHVYTPAEYDFGAGLYVGGGYPTIRNCTFVDNWAPCSGAIYVHGDTISQNDPLRLTNCSFVENSSTFAGALGVLRATVTLTNCTFYSNAATSG